MKLAIKYARSIFITAFVGALLYVLSYPPLLAARYKIPMPISIGILDLQFDLNEKHFMYVTHKFYYPLEWFIDNTPLDKPILAWAYIWNVHEEMKFDRAIRSLVIKEISKN